MSISSSWVPPLAAAGSLPAARSPREVRLCGGGFNGDFWLFAVAHGAVLWRFSRTPARKQIVLAVAPGQITSLEPSINQTLAQLQALYPIPTEFRNYSGLFPAQTPEGAGAGGGGVAGIRCELRSREYSMPKVR